MRLFCCSLAACLFVGSAFGLDDDQRPAYTPEDMDPAAVEAHNEFWRSFDDYERKRRQKRAAEIEADLSALDEKEKLARTSANRRQIESLEGAAKAYTRQLANDPEARNRAHVLLNLAQVLHRLAYHQDEAGLDEAGATREQALDALTNLDRKFPAFEHREQALYLRAIIEDSMGLTATALASWTKLAKQARESLYGVHAAVALGDHYFSTEDAQKSFRNYKKALRVLEKIDVADKDVERMRIQYRLAWAAYRSGEVDTAVSSAIELFTPGRTTHSRKDDQRIRQDGVELIGDSLFEIDEFPRVKRILNRDELKNYRTKIAMRTMNRLSAASLHRRVTRMGEFLIKRDPLAEEAPKWLMFMADSYDAVGNKERRLATLERLALFLPKTSLWRSRHQESYSVIEQMEGLAESASRLSAATYYERGLATGNRVSFRNAASYYRTLIEFKPNGDNSTSWRLKLAHCHYFTDELIKADKAYSELKEGLETDPEHLEVASYQLVLTWEKIWRKDFKERTRTKSERGKEAEDIIRNLEKAVEDYANRFPDRSRSVDLLLVAASVNRDDERFLAASQYWQRALISNPTPSQRAAAIRGLIFASMKKGSTAEVIRLTRNFLRLENWGDLGVSLDRELKGVLSSAAIDEGERLNNEGDVREAGKLLVSVAQEFKEVPDRAKLYRDGAYMLAIAGEWAAAQKSAEEFLAEGIKDRAGDMQYLLARSLEYQIRFAKAAESYLAVAERYPKHPRARASLERSETLAIAENRFDIATKAAALLAGHKNSKKRSFQYFQRSIEHAISGGDYNQAEKLAQQSEASARGPYEKLRSRLYAAEARMKLGKEDRALKDYGFVAKQAQRNRSKLGDDYGDVAGEAFLKLAGERKLQFEDFDIFERKGSLVRNINRKATYFEALAKAYKKVISTSQPAYSSEARFQIGMAAESLADDIATAQLRTKEKVRPKTKTRLEGTTKRLRRMARKFYGANVLARTRRPARYRSNIWVKKSALRLSGYNDSGASPEQLDELPVAVQSDYVQQWRMQ